MLQLQLYRQETIKNFQNYLEKDFKDQFIGMKIKEELRIKIQQQNIHIVSWNQILLELTDYLLQFIQIEMIALEDLKLEDIICQMELL